MNNIEKIIIKSINNSLTDKEQSELSIWLNENERNKIEYVKFKNIGTLINMSSGPTTDREKHIIDNSRININNRLFHTKPSISYIKYAAIFIGFIVLCTGGYFTLRDNSSALVPKAIDKSLVTRANNLSKSVILQKGDDIISLNSADKTIKIGQTVVHNDISKNELHLSSQHANNVASEQSFSTVIVPEGHKYNIILSDGTKVWLNHDSKLTFPNFFSDSIRQVELIGEAYFEVKPSTSTPFYIKTRYGNILVLGTKFNVKSYDNDENSKITLVEGSVRVSTSVDSLILSPSQQAVINSNKVISKLEVDTELFLSWMSSKSHYNNILFTEIAKDLSRKYGYDFNIINESIGSILMTISINDDMTLTDIVSAIKSVGENIYDVNIDYSNSQVIIDKV